MDLASGGDPNQIAYRRYVSRLTLAECRDRLQSATLGQPWEAIIRSPTPDVPTRISLGERRFVLVSRARDLQRFGIKVDGILSAVPRGTLIDLRLSSTAMTSVIKTTAIGLISLFALFALVGHLVSGVGLGLILAWPLLFSGILAIGLYRAARSEEYRAKQSVTEFFEQVLEAKPARSEAGGNGSLG
jgi:hypothetical protein